MLTNDLSAIMGLNISTSEPSQIVRELSVATTQKMASKEEKRQDTENYMEFLYW